jgi:hypothetical protein
MKLITTLSVLASLFLVSCQKEADFSNNSGNGGNNGGGTTGSGLLTKIVSKSGSDSSILAFGYNSSKKIITLNTTIVSGGTTSPVQERVERNSQGIITKLIIKSDFYQQSGFDSVETIIHYTGGRYTSRVTSFDAVVIVLKDSVSMIYDGTGKVVTEKDYLDFGTGSYEEKGKIDYTYSGSNIASIKNYSYDASSASYSLDQTYTYDQYDNKISPMSMGIEGFLFDSAPFYSSNNPTKSSVSSPLGGTYTYTTTYTYNSSNKPVTAMSTIQPGNSIATGTYYYQ